ncbi:hypothetical protein L1049_006880 [Liquidambar formosana]|uniref:Uncharacterized protein n=1 Tax=Liquidambar formosana TaxID=63359 RepID=A0AAP0RG75_LIQFO
MLWKGLDVESTMTTQANPSTTFCLRMGESLPEDDFPQQWIESTDYLMDVENSSFLMGLSEEDRSCNRAAHAWFKGIP